MAEKKTDIDVIHNGQHIKIPLNDTDQLYKLIGRNNIPNDHDDYNKPENEVLNYIINNWVEEGVTSFKIENDCLIEPSTHTLVFFLSDAETVNIPKDIEIIGFRAFYYSNISAINIPEGIKEIHGEAISPFNHKISEMTLPSTIKKIVDCDNYGDWFYHVALNLKGKIHVNGDIEKLLMIPGIVGYTVKGGKLVHKKGEWFRECIAK